MADFVDLRGDLFHGCADRTGYLLVGEAGLGQKQPDGKAPNRITKAPSAALLDFTPRQVRCLADNVFHIFDLRLDPLFTLPLRARNHRRPFGEYPSAQVKIRRPVQLAVLQGHSLGSQIVPPFKQVQNEVRGQPVRFAFGLDVMRVAAPQGHVRSRHQAGSHRIQVNVWNYNLEMLRVVNHLILESPPEHRPIPPILEVERLCVPPQQLLHASGQILPNTAHQQVEVIGHQHIRKGLTPQ
jgi:hypothetical protein